MKIWIAILFSFMIFLDCQAQDFTINLTGKIVNGSTPIYNVSVIDKASVRGTVSDVYGGFSLRVNPGSALTFSSIGYKTVHYTVPDTVRADNFRILVNMVADTVLLREAIVVPWPQNTTMLKQAMLSKRTEKETISPYAGFREIEGDPVEPEPKPFANPISFIYSKLNKKARQEKKIEKYRQILKQQEMYTPEEPIY